MNVTFEDFKKLDVRIGKILSAERIENADRLLKLEVDFGEFKRQIVSGIAQLYVSSDLIGKGGWLMSIRELLQPNSNTRPTSGDEFSC